VTHAPLNISRRPFLNRPAFGTAVARAILIRVAAGELPPTLRLHRPPPILALSRQDTAARGYGAATRAGRAAGFEPVVRLVGGRAAVYR
jgi:octanoyl-[GcvH]:protein N-octanoyltransferase